MNNNTNIQLSCLWILELLIRNPTWCVEPKKIMGCVNSLFIVVGKKIKIGRKHNNGMNKIRIVAEYNYRS